MRSELQAVPAHQLVGVGGGAVGAAAVEVGQDVDRRGVRVDSRVSAAARGHRGHDRASEHRLGRQALAHRGCPQPVER